MGDRKENLQRSIEKLKQLGTVKKMSNIYETEPEGMPKDTRPFYNMALCLESELRPAALLEKIKGIEQLMGRDLNNSHYRPRTLDIDILLANNEIINTGTLTIPHPRMHERAFVLEPLNEIAPDVMHPVFKTDIRQLFNNIPHHKKKGTAYRAPVLFD